MTDPYAIGLALTAFGFNLICTVSGVVWLVSNRINRHESAFLKAMNEHQISDNNAFAAVRVEIATSSDMVRREFGETGNAIRQHIHQIETWSRDTFLRRDSYYTATKEMTDDIKTVMQAIGRLEAQARPGKSHG